MYAADLRTTEAIRFHRSEQLRTRPSRHERILPRLRRVLGRRTATAETPTQTRGGAANTAGQPAC